MTMTSRFDSIPDDTRVRLTMEGVYRKAPAGSHFTSPNVGVVSVGGCGVGTGWIESAGAKVEVVQESAPVFGVGDLVKTADGEYGLVASPPRPSSFVNKPPVVSVKFDDNGETEAWSTDDLVIIVKAIGGGPKFWRKRP